MVSADIYNKKKFYSWEGENLSELYIADSCSSPIKIPESFFKLSQKENK